MYIIINLVCARCKLMIPFRTCGDHYFVAFMSVSRWRFIEYKFKPRKNPHDYWVVSLDKQGSYCKAPISFWKSPSGLWWFPDIQGSWNKIPRKTEISFVLIYRLLLFIIHVYRVLRARSAVYKTRCMWSFIITIV